MDLSLATIDQIIEELRNRSLEFALVVHSPESEGDAADDTEYHVHSSFAASSDEASLQEAVHCLLGSLTVIATLAEHLEEMEDERTEDFWRWKGAGETLLRDVFATVHEWSDEEKEEKID